MAKRKLKTVEEALRLLDKAVKMEAKGYDAGEAVGEANDIVANHSIDNSLDAAYYVKRWPEGYMILTNVESEDVEGAISAIDDILALFGRGGKHWCQRAFATVNDGIQQFCLSGALSAVDGKHEAIARAAIAVACGKGQDWGTNGSAIEDAIVTTNDRVGTTWKDVRKICSKAKVLIRRAGQEAKQ